MAKNCPHQIRGLLATFFHVEQWGNSFQDIRTMNRGQSSQNRVRSQDVVKKSEAN